LFLFLLGECNAINKSRSLKMLISWIQISNHTQSQSSESSGNKMKTNIFAVNQQQHCCFLFLLEGCNEIIEIGCHSQQLYAESKYLIQLSTSLVNAMVRINKICFPTITPWWHCKVWFFYFSTWRMQKEITETECLLTTLIWWNQIPNPN